MNGKDVKEIRTTLDMTQQEFATLVGVGLNTVNRWELGKHRISKLAQIRIEQIRDNHPAQS